MIDLKDLKEQISLIQDRYNGLIKIKENHEKEIKELENTRQEYEVQLNDIKSLKKGILSYKNAFTKIDLEVQNPVTNFQRKKELAMNPELNSLLNSFLKQANNLDSNNSGIKDLGVQDCITLINNAIIDLDNSINDLSNKSRKQANSITETSEKNSREETRQEVEIIKDYIALVDKAVVQIKAEKTSLNDSFIYFNSSHEKLRSLEKELEKLKTDSENDIAIQNLKNNISDLQAQRQQFLMLNGNYGDDMTQMQLDSYDSQIKAANEELSSLLKGISEKEAEVENLRASLPSIDPDEITAKWEQYNALQYSLVKPRTTGKVTTKNIKSILKSFDLNTAISTILEKLSAINPNIRTSKEENLAKAAEEAAAKAAEEAAFNNIIDEFEQDVNKDEQIAKEKEAKRIEAERIEAEKKAKEEEAKRIEEAEKLKAEGKQATADYLNIEENFYSTFDKDEARRATEKAARRATEEKARKDEYLAKEAEENFYTTLNEDEIKSEDDGNKQENKPTFENEEQLKAEYSDLRKRLININPDYEKVFKESFTPISQKKLLTMKYGLNLELLNEIGNIVISDFDDEHFKHIGSLGTDISNLDELKPFSFMFNDDINKLIDSPIALLIEILSPESDPQNFDKEEYSQHFESANQLMDAKIAVEEKALELFISFKDKYKSIESNEQGKDISSDNSGNLNDINRIFENAANTYEQEYRAETAKIKAVERSLVENPEVQVQAEAAAGETKSNAEIAAKNAKDAFTNFNKTFKGVIEIEAKKTINKDAVSLPEFPSKIKTAYAYYKNNPVKIGSKKHGSEEQEKQEKQEKEVVKYNGESVHLYSDETHKNFSFGKSVKNLLSNLLGRILKPWSKSPKQIPEKAQSHGSGSSEKTAKSTTKQNKRVLDYQAQREFSANVVKCKSSPDQLIHKDKNKDKNQGRF